MGYNTLLIPPTALSAGFTSNPAQIVDSDGYAIQLVFTGSICMFSAEIEVSTDPYFVPPASNYGQGNQPVINTPTNFDILTDSPQTFTTAGTFTYNVNPAEYVWIRIVITDNSGGTNNGTVQATLNVKGPLI